MTTIPGLRSLSSLRKDLLVARTVYKLARDHQATDKPGAVSYKELIGALKPMELDERQVRLAVDILFDQGMVKTGWVPVGKTHERGLEIAGEATSYVKAIFEQTEGLPVA